jgi:hypothetical protein
MNHLPRRVFITCYEDIFFYTVITIAVAELLGHKANELDELLTGVSVASCVRREGFRFLCRSTSNDLRIIRLTSFSRLNGCLILPR